MKKFLILLLFLYSFSLYSHPHMLLHSRTTFDFEYDKLKGVWLEWEFDAYFSADIIMSYDINSDGIFDIEETIDVYNNAFISLEDYGYFTYIRVGDKRNSAKEVKEFSVFTSNDESVVYKFYIDLKHITAKEFYLSVYDFTYFCACFYQEEAPVVFSNPGKLTPTYEIKKDNDTPIYFDPYAGPNDTTIHTKWKKGLSEIVIQEIHVKL